MSASARHLNAVSAASVLHKDQIKIVKQSDSVIIPDRKASLMKRISDMETELGRMMKLLNEMRADATHLTVE
jgi:hypothetical protein